MPIAQLYMVFFRIRFHESPTAYAYGSSGARIWKVDVNWALGDCWFPAVSTFLKYHWRIQSYAFFFLRYSIRVIVPRGQTQKHFLLPSNTRNDNEAEQKNARKNGRLKCHIVWFLACIKYSPFEIDVIELRRFHWNVAMKLELQKTTVEPVSRCLQSRHFNGWITLNMCFVWFTFGVVTGKAYSCVWFFFHIWQGYTFQYPIPQQSRYTY